MRQADGKQSDDRSLRLPMRPAVFVSWWVVATLALVASLLMGCTRTSEPTHEQIDNAERAVANVRESLYVPVNAKLQAEQLTYSTNPDIYPGCVTGYYLAAYLSPLDFKSIMADYHAHLLTEDWILSPDHKHTDTTIDILKQGTQTYLEISSHPIRSDILPYLASTEVSAQILTTYYVMVTYYDPLPQQCQG
jgi:hypothetical protein